MTHEPRTKEEIYESLRDSLTGQIAKLTNFTDRSFNYVWTQAFSEEIRELEVLATVSELAGWIDFTGKEITDDDLRKLGIEDDIDPSDINDFMKDDYLDEFVKIVGVTRDDGERATGNVTFTTQSANTDIPKGTRVTTTPDEDGNTIDFLTTEQAETTSGVTTVTDVSIEADDVGTDFNIPANEIVRLADPPIGVKGVDNPEATTGGEDEESNEDLRARAKDAVRTSSEGGTVDGIKGYLRNNVNGVGEGDVIVDEFTDPCPPFVDVIVDGGTENDVLDGIDASRPAGITHNLVRPQVVQLGFDMDLLGSDIETSNLKDGVETFLLNKGIGDTFYEDEFIREIMELDEDVINIDNLGGVIEKVTNEFFTFGTDIDAAVADDGGTTTDETTEANNTATDDITLLPASPATGDAYYFGEENMFSEIDINISTSGSGTWDIVWEYWDGSAWSSLSNVTDNTSDFTASTGFHTVNWDIPSDWATTNVDIHNGLFFVRARVDTFTSITTQPLGEEIDVTAPGYKLDYTYEDTNGSITVNDDSGDSYTEGTDYTMHDISGDGWKDMLVWASGEASPDEDETFSIDYDVTVDGETSVSNSHTTDMVRDEAFTFVTGREDTLTFDTDTDVYDLSYIPFDGTISIEDENSTSYTQDIDWAPIPDPTYASEDSFTYSSGTSQYELSNDIVVDYVSVYDTNDNVYVRGSDYDTVNSDSDSHDDTIEWELDIDAAVADDGGTTTDETSEANNDTADDMTLLPQSPQTGDAYYFGHNEIFGEFNLNISTAGDGTWDVVWEYWNGSSWAALSNVTDNTSDFQNSGENTVEFDKPSDWSQTTVGGLGDHYYVRGRLDSFSSLSVQPFGQEVEIGAIPGDSTDFTVTYDAYPKAVRWDPNDSTPSDNDDFTVTYDQAAYSTEYEIVETPEGQLSDISGDTYEEDTDYKTIDEDRDTEDDAIYWTSNPSTLDNGERFYFTYFNEGDVNFDNREKADPGTLSVTQV